MQVIFLQETGVSELLNDYRAISQQASDDDTAKAYLQFSHDLKETSEVELVSISARNPRARAAAESAFNKRHTIHSGSAKQPNGPYYRGSGIIVSATRTDILDILCKIDEDGRDLVAEHYGASYRKVAFDKVGRAALLAKLQGVPGGCYERLEEVLREQGVLTELDPPHHLGYDFEVSSTGLVTTAGEAVMAGASGMLPSEDVSAAFRSNYKDMLAKDYEKGWLEEWEPGLPSLDEAAGFHDLLAANHVTSVLALGTRGFAFDAREMHARGVNLH